MSGDLEKFHYIWNTPGTGIIEGNDQLSSKAKFGLN